MKSNSAFTSYKPSRRSAWACRPAASWSITESSASTAIPVTYGQLLGDKPFAITFTGTAPRKQAAQYKLVGTRVPRIDMPDQVAGKYTYMQYVRVPDMVHGRVVRPRGQRTYGSRIKVTRIDERSIADIPDARVVHRVDFIGVVAEREWDAVKAAQQLDVTCADTAPLPDWGKLAELMRATKSVDTVVVDIGDPEKAFARAAHVASAPISRPTKRTRCSDRTARLPTWRPTARW